MPGLPDLSMADKYALEELTENIKSRWPLATILVFGSKVRGTADAESDLDVLIETEKKHRIEVRKTYSPNHRGIHESGGSQWKRL